jgi:hypothetical protein
MEARFAEEQSQQAVESEPVQLPLDLARAQRSLVERFHLFPFRRRRAQPEVEPDPQRSVLLFRDGVRYMRSDRGAVERAIALMLQRRVRHEREVRRLPQPDHDGQLDIVAATAAEPATTIFLFRLADGDEQRPVLFTRRGPFRGVEVERAPWVFALDPRGFAFPFRREEQVREGGFHGR